MKKILMSLFAIIIILTLSGCGAKKEVTANEFKTILTKAGYSVNDITSVMEDSNVVTVETAGNSNFQFEFYVFKSEALAKAAYKSNKKLFESSKIKSKEKNEDTYDKYIQQTDTSYNTVIRVGKTILYGSVGKDYKGDLKNAISKLGY